MDFRNEPGPADRWDLSNLPTERKGRIRHSLAHWCLETSAERWTLEQTCAAAKRLGVASVELLTADHYATLQRHGLTCALGQIDMGKRAPFVRGFNNPVFWPEVLAATTKAIDAAAACGVPSVVCFTGFSARDPDDPQSPLISPEEGIRNCVEGFGKIVGYAEEHKVTLCLENLNTREDSHPMKGHPGYQGDRVDYCVEILERVGSSRLKLLFDVYHAQIMEGDIIRRLRDYHEYLGHVHVAGNPGRHELDEHQELNFPAIMRTLLDVGYQGYVGQEFLPTGDVFEGLAQAIELCDV
jgi:hydroxypyruvate isomerase